LVVARVTRRPSPWTWTGQSRFFGLGPNIFYLYIYISKLIAKSNHLNPRGPGGAVRHVLVAYEVGGSTLFFVCRRTLGETLPPGSGISLGEAWDILVNTKKKSNHLNNN
jgi:hypothetical protein